MAQQADDGLEAAIQRTPTGTLKDTVLINDICAYVSQYATSNRYQAFYQAYRALGYANTIGHDESLSKVYLALAEVHYYDAAYDSLLHYAEKALLLAGALKNASLQAEAYYEITRAYYERAEYQMALEYAEKGLLLYEQIDNEAKAAVIENALGRIYFELGLYERALDYYFEALMTKRRGDDKGSIAATLANIGGVYYELKDFDRALDYLIQSGELFLTVGNQFNHIIVLRRTARCYQAIGQLDQALVTIEKSLELSQQEDNPQLLAELYNTYGNILAELKDYTRAERNYKQALALSADLENSEERVVALTGLAQTYLVGNQLDMALTTALQAEEDARQRPPKSSKLAVYELLAEIYEQKGLFEEALLAEKEALATERILFTERTERIRTELEYRYKQEQTRAELAERDQVSQVTGAYRTLLIISGLVVVVLGFFIWRAYMQKQRAALALIHKNQELEKAYQEITENIKLLETRRKEIIQLSKEKDDFLGIAAHDLKNPIAAVRIFSSLLRDRGKDLSTDEMMNYADKIYLSAEQMFDIVSHLLDINRLEQGHLESEPQVVSLHAVLDQALEVHKHRAAFKSISLTLQVLTAEYDKLKLDARLTSQVLDNLISNAIKYTPNKGNVSVKAEVFESRVSGAYWLQCSVLDDGPGISTAEQLKLFQKFSRLSTRPTAGESSTGLGLYIVRKMVELQGGRVWVESEPGHGSCFYMEVPVELAAPAKRKAASSQPA